MVREDRTEEIVMDVWGKRDRALRNRSRMALPLCARSRLWREMIGFPLRMSRIGFDVQTLATTRRGQTSAYIASGQCPEIADLDEVHASVHSQNLFARESGFLLRCSPSCVILPDPVPSLLRHCFSYLHCGGCSRKI